MSSDRTLDASVTGSLDATRGHESGDDTIDGGRHGHDARLELGSMLGEYRLEQRLGAGAMGEVFLARRGEQPAVALKVLPEVHGSRLYRFKREFRSLAGVRHENLITLDELIVLPDARAFFTMEHVAGVPFVDYVRGETACGRLPNLARLERALRQLAEGVRHLHRAGYVHRDLKPSNVLVTREGRVVILDFGLVSELSDGQDLGEGQMMGTPAYMAPEQSGLDAIGPAADFYALGVMLFECLTGTLPFSGSVLHIIIEKRDGVVPDPRTRLDASVTLDERASSLCDLSVALMAADPAARPEAGLFARLGEAASAEPRASASRRVPFVGRTHELAQLDAARRRVAAERAPVTVHLRGASGQGKSTLVAHFLADLRESGEHPRGELVVLRGRCLERESVPYKGIDAIVDALALYLRRLDASEAAALRPRHVGPLRQLFPVLRAAWPTRDELDAGASLDPGELRRRGLAGLRELLTALARDHLLVVEVDDFQWADVDSARVLSELMRPPEPPAMLLIVGFRDEVDERESLQLLTCAEALDARDVRELVIGPLPDDDARELAEALLAARPAHARTNEAATNVELLARRARGNPFYIGQLVLGSDDAHGSSDVSLDRLVARRIVALAADERRVLTTLAVAGGPTPLAVLREACPDIALARELEPLAASELVRRSDDERIETAHDRIREVAVGELSPDELRATHLALGHAFERLELGEAEELAEHFSRGGDMARALDYTERAADQARAALAFERAARLYRRALALLDEQQSVRRRALELALAEQLVDLGRGAEAAAMLQTLADTAASPRASRELRRRAASELVKSGYLDEGMDAISPVLRELGLWQPRGWFAAILGTLYDRALLLVRGYGFTVRDEAEIDARLLERIDSLLATKTGLSHHEAIFAGYQQAKAIRLALPAGEPRRLIRCLVHEASIFVAIGRRERGQALMARARELVRGVREPEFHRVIEYVTANHLDHSGRWSDALAAFDTLFERLDESPNSGWIRGAATVQRSYVRKLLGQLGRLHAELPELVAHARDLGIRHELVSLGCLRAHVLAIYGEREAATRLLAEMREQWHARQVTFQHILLAMTEVELALLDDRPRDALEVVERVLGNTKTRIVATMMPSHVDVYELRARCLIRLALAGEDGTHAPIRRDLAKLRKSHKPQVGPLARLLDASLCNVVGDASGAELHWRAAAEQLEALGMAAHLAAVHARLGARGDTASEARARAYFEAERIPDPHRLVATLAP